MSNFLSVYKEALNKLSIEVLYPNLSITIRSSNSYNCHCPFHNHNSKEGTAFIIFKDTKRFKCLSCRISGDPVDYQYSLNLGFFQSSQNNKETQKELMQEIISEANLDNKIEHISQNIDSVALNKDDKSHDILEDFYKFCRSQLWIGKEEYTEKSKSYLPLGVQNDNNKIRELKEKANKALSYLISRGFTEEQILNLEIGFYSSFEYLRAYMMRKYHFVNEVKSLKIVWNGYEDYLTFAWRDVKGNPSTCYFRYPDKNVPEGKKRLCALKGENTKSCPLFLDRVLQANHKNNLIAVEGILYSSRL
ncbi:CHC2 zinc finger domain-containing protein [Geminocystis herdmanii]|uniref:CHC2 zinc finger domain-containing protein n=1 Tax=Geminocystis herdmanii TaxID=669359 RepID=UPI0003699F31|nr:CHC2 zinc finger domain-containing protein [Geminocystis herdmanii]